MARRILNRKDLRADFEAAEARRKGDEEEDTEEAEDADDEDEDEEEDEDEDEEAAESDEGGSGGDEDDEEAPAPKKKKKPAKPAKPAKEPKPKRVRTPKHVRQKVVWVVFDNSSKKIASYDYPKKKEADEHAARLKAEKNQTFFVQPVKENIEEK